MIGRLAQRWLPPTCALLLTGLLPACGEAERPPAQTENKPAPLTADEKRELIQSLLESEDEQALAVNIDAAEKRGLPQQAILEARFLFLVDRQNYAALAALAPALDKQKGAFQLQDSQIFNVPEEFFAIVEYAKALRALESGDRDAFKAHITEAFWLSPRQAQAFGPHIERLRLEEAMANVNIDPAREFRKQTDGSKVTLAAAANDSKHLLLHFWSPWSAECEDNLPDFIAMAEELHRHNIVVVSVLIESDSETITAANQFRAGIESENVGTWIVDNPDKPLNRTLRVLELPAVVLLSAQGAVLYNGHPADQALWSALKQAAPSIKRPHLELPE